MPKSKSFRLNILLYAAAARMSNRIDADLKKSANAQDLPLHIHNSCGSCIHCLVSLLTLSTYKGPKHANTGEDDKL